MENIRCCEIILLVILVSLTGNFVKSSLAGWEESFVKYHDRHPAKEFSGYSIVEPVIYHKRDKRTTTQEDSSHQLLIRLPINNNEEILDLALNKQLISKNYFRITQENGTHKVQTFNPKDIDLCHYTGKVRDKPKSWVALSTCDGVSGVIYDGDQMYYIEKSRKTKNGHFLYSRQNLINKNTREEEVTKTTSEIKENTPRHERSVRGPWNANTDSRYVELVLVVDNGKYKDMNGNLKQVEDYCKTITNIMNALYFPLNIFIALVGVVVWTERDEIKILTDADQTLTNFLQYRREKLIREHPNDNAQLLIKSTFVRGVDKALVTPICTFEYSGGVTSGFSSVVGATATTVARMLGHNFGMKLDTAECECPDQVCIMNNMSLPATQWSSCSRNAIQSAYQQGMDHCLKNKPKTLFQSPICGNGFVEDGEECDCGLPEDCNSRCCNPQTCKLHSSAVCATGDCCDLQTCRFKDPGKICRSVISECDLPEYCTGDTEFCPRDVYRMDTESCAIGDGYCYQGRCNTHLDQCRLVWGISSQNGVQGCYLQNNKGTKYGNCGYNKINKTFTKCNHENVFCGMLHCNVETNADLRYGLKTVGIYSHYNTHYNGNVVSCKTANIDLGLSDPDPGMVPNGAKCGEGKMCLNQKCVSIKTLQKDNTCFQNCYNNGWCNNLRHCHCKPGYSLPYCQYLTPGGSIDSGPPETDSSQFYNPLL